MIIMGVAALFGLIGVLLFGAGLGRVFKLRFASGFARTLGGGFLMLLAAVSGLIGVNLGTYSRLTYEQVVATLSFTQEGPQTYLATLELPDGEITQYPVAGDEWRLEARVLDFHPRLNVAGVDDRFKLDRLSGRYRDVADETGDKPRSAHQLGAAGLDLWKEVNDRFPDQSFVQADQYGSGVYLPMADGAAFEIKLAQSGGLKARGLNDAGAAIARDWR